MCYTATLPSVIKSENLNSDLLKLTRIFNRWLKMLTSYGKLDESSYDDDFLAISKVVKGKGIKKDIKSAVKRCRDYALAETLRIKDFISSLNLALNLMCQAQEDKEISKIRKDYADQGMSERYRPLCKRLKKEKIRKIGREVMYTDFHTDDAETTKLVRRIVEKRAAQAVHHIYSNRARETNSFRQNVRRATSFSLYNANFTEYDVQKRAAGTHWKVVHVTSKGKMMLKAKFCYKSYEEAVEACNRYIMAHPGDPRKISAYKCEHCGKWHIGHERMEGPVLEQITKSAKENLEKIYA